jgi:purine nucleoside permease
VLTEPPGVSLGGVQVLASNNVYAVGTFSLGTLITRWTGRNWKIVPSPIRRPAAA